MDKKSRNFDQTSGISYFPGGRIGRPFGRFPGGRPGQSSRDFLPENKKSTESRPLISYLMDFLNMRWGVHPTSTLYYGLYSRRGVTCCTKLFCTILNMSPPPLYNSGSLCYVSIFACVMCSFMLVDCADCSTLLAPLVAGASRPQGSLREPVTTQTRYRFPRYPTL